MLEKIARMEKKVEKSQSIRMKGKRNLMKDLDNGMRHNAQKNQIPRGRIGYGTNQKQQDLNYGRLVNLVKKENTAVRRRIKGAYDVDKSNGVFMSSSRGGALPSGNKWINFVRQFSAKHNLSWKEAMMKAKPHYQKLGGALGPRKRGQVKLQVI